MEDHIQGGKGLKAARLKDHQQGTKEMEGKWDIKHVKELMTAMQRNDISRVKVSRDGMEIELERKETGAFPSYGFQEANGVNEESFYPKNSHGPANSLPTRKDPVESHKEEEIGTFITSPMVGTFYSTPAPDDPPFVKVGDKVDKNTVVCIIEAMKVMNEVRAQASGIVVEVLVDNNEPVEFGTKLIRIS